MEVYTAVFLTFNLTTFYLYCFTIYYPKAPSSLRLLQEEGVADVSTEIVAPVVKDIQTPISNDFEVIHLMAILYIWYTVLHFLRGNWHIMWILMFLGLIITEIIFHVLLKKRTEFMYTWTFLLPIYLYFFINSYFCERASLQVFLLKNRV